MSTERRQPNPVRAGELAPDFTLPMHPQGVFTLSALRGRTVVLYWYPRDDTPGCTREACGFRDLASEFARHNAAIFGVSKDSLKSHAGFAAKYSLPFPLLSDASGTVLQQYANPQGLGKMLTRITYIIDKHGTVRHVVNADGKAKVPDHIEQALHWARKLAGE
jgi:peroxiredoxin Q/BCP